MREQFTRMGKDDADLYAAVKAKLTGKKALGFFDKHNTLEKLLNAYEERRSALMEEPDSTTPEVLKFSKIRPDIPEITGDLLEAFLQVAAENAPKVESDLVPDKGQNPKLEAQLRKESAEQQRRIAKSVTASPHLSAQLIITNDKDEEFVMDRIGQLVPRKVYRGISTCNNAELEAEEFMYPTGESPIPKDKKTYEDFQQAFTN